MVYIAKNTIDTKEGLTKTKFSQSKKTAPVAVFSPKVALLLGLATGILFFCTAGFFLLIWKFVNK